jgi:hypothetical protein
MKLLYAKGLLDCSGPAEALADQERFSERLEKLRHKDWVVYAKPPFGDPAHVLRYLGRYTHRIAISNVWSAAVLQAKMRKTEIGLRECIRP